MVECVPNSNLSYCYLNSNERIINTLNSWTPIGVKLWVLIAIIMAIILSMWYIIYVFKNKD